MTRQRRWLGLAIALLALVLTGLPALGDPGDSYVRPFYGDGDLPAGCVVDTNPANPDNRCFHMKVGLNALDSPQVDVAVLVPVSPTAERDLRLMKQVVHMWDGGIHYLSGQMDLPWLRDGVKFHVTGEAVPVDEDGNMSEPVDLVDPEIVVVATNPVGGIGIGIDPAYFAKELQITDGEGVPCMEVPNVTSMAAWEANPGYDGHHGDEGGVYVEDCNGQAGGNVCFAVNGAIDPLPGETDLFGIFDLIAHEFGHCLTLGHVGDGADGPWGPTPTNDIMAYSTDPPGITKCVSTLDVEGFALRMSRYLDANGDKQVTKADVIKPNDVAGDGANSYQVQHPDDHHYASATGDPADCPQPDSGFVPGATTDWTPKPVTTTRPRLSTSELAIRDGRLTVVGAAARLPIGGEPTKRSGAAEDPAGDATNPVTDLTNVTVDVSARYVDAVLKVGQVNPLTDGASMTAYSLLVSGRRFDSYIANGTTDSTPTTIDNGSGAVMPAGTSTWDAATNTVKFRISRAYLEEQWITAPYDVSGQTGFHARSNDWLLTDDVAPDKRGIGVDGPAIDRGPSPDAPVAGSVTTRTVTLENEGGNTFTPADTTAGVGLSPVDTRDRLPLGIAKQATVKVTLTWDDPASFLGLHVNGGSGEIVKDGDQSVTVTVPWARRDLVVTVDPEEIISPQVTYTVKATVTTVIQDGDGDGVPDVADSCDGARGPSEGAGCPDSDRDGTIDRADRCPREPGTGADGCRQAGDERVVVLVDGQQVDAQGVLTQHGRYGFSLGAPVSRGAHDVRILWYAGSRIVASMERRLG